MLKLNNSPFFQMTYRLTVFWNLLYDCVLVLLAYLWIRFLSFQYFLIHFLTHFPLFHGELEIPSPSHPYRHNYDIYHVFQ